MSAFVCLLDRSGAPVAPALLHRLGEALDGYGTAVSVFHRGSVGLLVRHPVAVLPEAHGPLLDPDSGRAVAVAGRLLALPEEPGTVSPTNGRAGGAPPTGAALALDLLRRDERRLASATAGEFAVVVADPARGRLTITRDQLGALKVYYHLGPRWLIAASEPAALLRHPAVAGDLDEVAAARFLGFRFTHSERSFYRQIRELPPAHELTADHARVDVRQCWRFRHRRSLPRGLVVGAVRSCLGHSLDGQLRGLDPRQAAISLSGGLDSTALAALAPAGVQAFSWQFRETGEGDERGAIQAVVDHLQMPLHWIRGDDLVPLSEGWDELFVHRGSPHVNAFAALKRCLYRAAAAAGCRRILVGDAGDALYGAREYWLRDLFRDAVDGAPESLRRTALAAARGDRFARLGLRRLIADADPLRHPPPPSWLTRVGSSLLPAPALSPILPDTTSPRRHELTAGARNIELESEESRLFAGWGIARGNPYWYWPLLELVLALPAWWLHRDGLNKVLTRRLSHGRLPAAILRASRGGLLGSLYLRGIAKRRQDLRELLFHRPQSDWRRYVRSAWLEPYLEASDSIRFGHTILWRVISYELWQRKLLGSPTLG